MDKKLYAAPGLRKAREEMGLMQKDMVEVLNTVTDSKISLSLYQKWEQGIASVNLTTAIQISKGIERPFMDLWESKRASEQPTQEQTTIDEMPEEPAEIDRGSMDYVPDDEIEAKHKKKHGIFG